MIDGLLLNATLLSACHIVNVDRDLSQFSFFQNISTS